MRLTKLYYHCVPVECQGRQARRPLRPKEPSPMPVITRRRFLSTALAAGATPLSARAVRAQTAVKSGSAVLGDYSMAGPVIVALDQGYFKSEGLTAEYVPFRGGPDLLKAVMAGGCPLRVTGRPPTLRFF